jgi:hypothetical protein
MAAQLPELVGATPPEKKKDEKFSGKVEVLRKKDPVIIVTGIGDKGAVWSKDEWENVRSLPKYENWRKRVRAPPTEIMLLPGGAKVPLFPKEGEDVPEVPLTAEQKQEALMQNIERRARAKINAEERQRRKLERLAKQSEPGLQRIEPLPMPKPEQMPAAPVQAPAAQVQARAEPEPPAAAPVQPSAPAPTDVPLWERPYSAEMNMSIQDYFRLQTMMRNYVKNQKK